MFFERPNAAGTSSYRIPAAHSAARRSQLSHLTLVRSWRAAAGTWGRTTRECTAARRCVTATLQHGSLLWRTTQQHLAGTLNSGFPWVMEPPPRSHAWAAEQPEERERLIVLLIGGAAHTEVAMARALGHAYGVDLILASTGFTSNLDFVAAMEDVDFF